MTTLSGSAQMLWAAMLLGIVALVMFVRVPLAGAELWAWLLAGGASAAIVANAANFVGGDDRLSAGRIAPALVGIAIFALLILTRTSRIGAIHTSLVFALAWGILLMPSGVFWKGQGWLGSTWSTVVTLAIAAIFLLFAVLASDGKP